MGTQTEQPSVRASLYYYGIIYLYPTLRQTWCNPVIKIIMIEYLLSTYSKPVTDPHKMSLYPPELPSCCHGELSASHRGAGGSWTDFVFPESKPERNDADQKLGPV